MMQHKNNLEVLTFGKFYFELLSEDEKNLLYTSLLTTIFEIHKEKQIKRMKQK